MLFELAQTFWPRRSLRLAGIAFGVAGLIAHTLFLGFNRPTIASPYGSLLALGWIVAVFYLFGTLHHGRLAWALFVLPIVLILLGLAEAFPRTEPDSLSRWFTGDHFWGLLHGTFLLLAAVGLTVGAVASLMYLVQTWRLRSKAAPGSGLKMLSLERLADMNRRAVTWSFPLISAGLLVGIVLLAQYKGPSLGWTAPRVISTAGLWLAFLALVLVRYVANSSNRRIAVLTLIAFGLMLLTLASAHPVVSGGSP